MLGSLLDGHTGVGGAPSRLAALLDLDGDGNPLDDILQMADKAMR
jgi:hypothetical protein